MTGNLNLFLPSHPDVAKNKGIKLSTFHPLRAQTQSDVVRVKMLGMTAVAVVGPTAARDVLGPQNASKFLRGPVNLQQTIVSAAENSLFALQGAKWQKHRRLATPAFSMRHLRSLIGDFQHDANGEALAHG